jgi:hypothetical protein
MPSNARVACPPQCRNARRSTRAPGLETKIQPSTATPEIANNGRKSMAGSYAEAQVPLEHFLERARALPLVQFLIA